MLPCSVVITFSTCFVFILISTLVLHALPINVVLTEIHLGILRQILLDVHAIIEKSDKGSVTLNAPQ